MIDILSPRQIASKIASLNSKICCLDKKIGDGNLTVDANPTDNSVNAVSSNGVFDALNLKVDKVSGKRLSTEDYTTVDKNKVALLSGTNTGDQDISGIATNATNLSNEITNRTNADTTLQNNINLKGDAFETTISGLRSLSSPSSSIRYYTTDIGKEGFWYYDSTDTTSTDNTGTILVSGTKRFKRIFGSTINATWFGTKADSITDDFDSVQNALNSLNGTGVLILPSGTIYFNKVNGGGIILPTDSNGLVIRGSGKNQTIIKLSANVPRAFDCPGISSTSLTKTYKNIILEDITIDANNIDGTALGASIVATSSVTAPNNNFINISVASTSGLQSKGLLFFPLTNTGNVAGKTRQFIVLNSTTVQINLATGETINSGDSLVPANWNHVIIGTDGDNYTSVTDRNINFDNIVIRNIDAINIPSKNPSATNTYTELKRKGIALDTRVATGYTGTLSITNIKIENVRIFGGIEGFIVIGNAAAYTPENVFIDNVLIDNCYHTTGIIPTLQYESLNFLVGNNGFGNNVLIRNCRGDGSADVGIETDAFLNTRVENCVINNAYGSAYFHTNYNYPAASISGTPSTTLNGNITNSTNTATLTVIPTGISNTGWATIGGTELVYYILQNGGNNITIIRDLNQTTGIAHTTGEAVKFFEAGKQTLIYTNCTATNTLLPDGAGPGWLQGRNSTVLFPQSNTIINTCKYYRTTTDLPQNGDAINLGGHRQFINIDGFESNVSGINHPTSDSRSTSVITLQNKDMPANPTTTSVPAMIERIKNVDIRASGFLSNGASNKANYRGIQLVEGNHLLDMDGISIALNFLNTNGVQTFGMHLGFSTNYISGTINNYKFSNRGDDIIPVGILSTSTTSVGKLIIDNTDYREMRFGTSADNSNYRGYQFDAANVKNVFVLNTKAPIVATSPIASRTKHRVEISANYTATFDDEVIAVTSLSAPITITLPKVTSTTVGLHPNAGATLTIIDESNSAATNNITLATTSSELINAVSTYVVNTNGAVINLSANKIGWNAGKLQ